MRYLWIATALACLSGTAQAADYTEANAGQTLGTAADTTMPASGAAIGNIFGSFSTLQDADLYRIYIGNAAAFSASAINGTSSNVDTALFLLDSTGRALVTNDDANGFEVQAALPAGSFAGLTAGYYYLGISNSGNEPVNSANQLLFERYPNGDTTARRGAASGVTPTTLAGFDSFASDQGVTGFGVGAYRITLNGVTAGPAATQSGVPEPATWAMMIAGFGLVGSAMRRTRKGVRVTFA